MTRWRRGGAADGVPLRDQGAEEVPRPPEERVHQHRQQHQNPEDHGGDPGATAPGSSRGLVPSAQLPIEQIHRCVPIPPHHRRPVTGAPRLRGVKTRTVRSGRRRRCRTQRGGEKYSVGSAGRGRRSHDLPPPPPGSRPFRSAPLPSGVTRAGECRAPGQGRDPGGDRPGGRCVSFRIGDTRRAPGATRAPGRRPADAAGSSDGSGSSTGRFVHVCLHWQRVCRAAVVGAIADTSAEDKQEETTT